MEKIEQQFSKHFCTIYLFDQRRQKMPFCGRKDIFLMWCFFIQNVEKSHKKKSRKKTTDKKSHKKVARIK